jgi:hypothetical protein
MMRELGQKIVLKFKYILTSVGIYKRMSFKTLKCVHTLGVGIMLYAKSLEQGLGDQILPKLSLFLILEKVFKNRYIK